MILKGDPFGLPFFCIFEWQSNHVCLNELIMKKFFISLVLFFFILSVEGRAQKDNYVLLVSFDAFRFDYVERLKAPNFKEFMAHGIAVESLISTFPSKTFANHYSIITGLQAGHNGLVDNLFYDDSLATLYTTANRPLVEDPVFYGGLPLWQLVQNNGMKSASYFWPGSETQICGRYPDYWKKYDGSVSNIARIDSVMQWLRLPEKERPRFVSLYFSFTDDVGHRYGPNSSEMNDAILQADSLLGYIMEELGKIELEINVIVLSDHGMAEIEPKTERLLLKDDILAGLDTTGVVTIFSDTHARFYCKNDSLVEQLYEGLKAKESFFTVYKKQDMPFCWHSANNKRVGELVLVMQPGFIIVSPEAKQKILQNGKTIGVHGYDPYYSDVRGVFYAQGPRIVRGRRIPSFENVHVYPFVAELLGIRILPEIDGEIEVLNGYLKQ